MYYRPRSFIGCFLLLIYPVDIFGAVLAYYRCAFMNFHKFDSTFNFLIRSHRMLLHFMSLHLSLAVWVEIFLRWSPKELNVFIMRIKSYNCSSALVNVNKSSSFWLLWLFSPTLNVWLPLILYGTLGNKTIYIFFMNNLKIFKSISDRANEDYVWMTERHICFK